MDERHDLSCADPRPDSPQLPIERQRPARESVPERGARGGRPRARRVLVIDLA
jgi:hypothetical protein